MRKRYLYSGLFCLGLTWANPLLADTLIQRVEALEKKVQQHQLNADLLQQVTRLQEELQELRGQLEDQSYLVQQLKKNPAQTLSSQPEKSNAESLRAIENQEKTLSSVTEVHLYQEAYRLLQEKRFAQAIHAFENCLAQYPEGKYVSNVHYWLGEIYWLKAQENNRLEPVLVGQAEHAFHWVVNHDKAHQKVADALLKLGIIQQTKRDYKEAKGYFERVQQEYPKTPSARIAKIRLEKMELNN